MADDPGSVLAATSANARTWGPSNALVWVDEGSGKVWLAQTWICYETGEVEYKPLPTVYLPKKDNENG